MGMNTHSNIAAITNGREAVTGLVIEDLETPAVGRGDFCFFFAFPADTEQTNGRFAV